MEGKLVHHPASIADVARESGVSKATVSNWLNGRTARLSEETRLRLEEVSSRLGYRPMLGARRLSSRARSGTVALLLRRDLAGTFADPYFAEVLEGVGRALATGGTRALVVTAPPGPREDTEYLLSLARGIVDGLLVFDIEHHDRTLEAFVKHGVPFVAVGQPEDEAEFPWAGTDHAGAVAEAVIWLAERGHTQVTIELGPATVLLNRHRRRGYELAVDALGLSRDPLHPTAVLRTRQRHLEAPPPPGAEVVLLDGFARAAPAHGAWIEAPSALVGERAAFLLEQRIAGGTPASELHPARFHPAPTGP